MNEIGYCPHQIAKEVVSEVILKSKKGEKDRLMDE